MSCESRCGSPAWNCCSTREDELIWKSVTAQRFAYDDEGNESIRNSCCYEEWIIQSAECYQVLQISDARVDDRKFFE